MKAKIIKKGAPVLIRQKHNKWNYMNTQTCSFKDQRYLMIHKPTGDILPMHSVVNCNIKKGTNVFSLKSWGKGGYR